MLAESSVLRGNTGAVRLRPRLRARFTASRGGCWRFSSAPAERVAQPMWSRIRWHANGSDAARRDWWPETTDSGDSLPAFILGVGYDAGRSLDRGVHRSPV